MMPQHILIRIRGHWHHHWCLVARWIPWDHHEPWCICRGHNFYVCPFCFKISNHPEDARNRYCGNCHVFADPYLNTVAEAPDLVTINPETGILELTIEGVQHHRR